MLPALRFGGWFLPQFLVAGWVESRPRKVPIAVAMEATRIAIYALLCVLTLAIATTHPALLLVLFFALFTLSRVTAGTGALARTDALGKLIPSSRRATFFANRNFWGGALVFGAGLLVRALLDPERGQPFPVSFSILFALSCASFTLAALSFQRVRETPSPVRRSRRSLGSQLARAPGLVQRDPDLQSYLQVRVLLNMTRIAAPFYPIFALEILGAPPYMVGLYLSAMTLASVMSNLYWRRVGRARGPVYLIKTCSLLAVLTPLMAATLPVLMRAVGFTGERYGLLPAYLFTPVFLVAGIGNSGRSIGFMALALDIAPPEQRASYVGLVNTVLGFVSLLPIVSGIVIDRVGYVPVFYFATAILALGCVVALRWRPRLERGTVDSPNHAGPADRQ
jgi:hypothetical protein